MTKSKSLNFIFFIITFLPTIFCKKTKKVKIFKIYWLIYSNRSVGLLTNCDSRVSIFLDSDHSYIPFNRLTIIFFIFSHYSIISVIKIRIKTGKAQSKKIGKKLIHYRSIPGFLLLSFHKVFMKKDSTKRKRAKFFLRKHENEICHISWKPPFKNSNSTIFFSTGRRPDIETKRCIHVC